MAIKTYTQLKQYWQGSVGIAVRSLLDLNNKSGAWLWFEYAMEDFDITSETTAGQIVIRMLEYRLNDFKSRGIGQ